MIVCVYALIAPSSSGVVGTGMRGERLRAVKAGGITALVGELSRAPKPTMMNLRRYAKAVEEAAAQTRAILPVRFGAGLADIDEVVAVLRSRRDALQRRLRAVRGRTQMTIRVRLRSSRSHGAAPADAPSPEPDLSDPESRGRQYLKGRARVAARAREIPGFAPIRAATQRWVKDERVEKRAGVAIVNQLVPRGSVSAYRAAVERAADRAGLQVLITGPFPPYAFAEHW